tara:strand:+ start:98 stop:1243 length:1146 start_codon:yes stop_codon:yes gene_type:complete
MGQCILNGQSVGSVNSEAACNAGGGKWIPDQSESSGDSGSYWKDRSTLGKAGDALFYGSMAIPATWAGRGLWAAGKGGLAAIKNADKIKKLMAGIGNKFSGTGKNLKKVFPGAQGVKGHKAYTNPKYLWTKPNLKSSYPINPHSARMRQFSPIRAAGTAGIGIQGGASAYNAGMIPGTDPRATKLETKRKAEIEKMMAAQKNIDAKSKAVTDAKSETERVEGLDFFGRMGEEGYWDKSFSGNPNDTRLQRITDLVGDMSMSKKEYNAAKKAGVTAEQKWRDTEQEQATLIASLQESQIAANAKSKYGKMTPANLVKQVSEMVEERFDSIIPLAGASDEELEGLKWLVAETIIEISNDPNNPGLSQAEAIEMALNYVEENYT